MMVKRYRLPLTGRLVSRVPMQGDKDAPIRPAAIGAVLAQIYKLLPSNTEGYELFLDSGNMAAIDIDDKSAVFSLFAPPEVHVALESLLSASSIPFDPSMGLGINGRTGWRSLVDYPDMSEDA